VLLCAAISADPFWAAKSSSKKESQPAGPALKLTVTPRHGFRPLTLTLTGSLTGVETDNQEFCHAGVEWESRTPSGLMVTSKEDPRCLHPPEQVDVQFTFTKVETISRAGTYVYRLILHRRDGGRLLSNTQEIRVLETN